MNIVKTTASIFGKATKLVVSLTGNSFNSMKAGFAEGYTGINATPKVEAPVSPVAPTVQRQPVQQEFNFTQPTPTAE